jgi:hypothetical protein
MSYNICYCPMLQSIFAHPNQVRSRISGAIPPLLHLPSWYVQGQLFFTLLFSGAIYILMLNGFGGLEVVCWPLVPKLAGSHPAEAVGFLGWKILSTPSFGGEVKPSVPCRSPKFHLPPMGSLAWWQAWRRLVAKVGTSNPNRTISIKRLQCLVENKIKYIRLLDKETNLTPAKFKRCDYHVYTNTCHVVCVL